MKAREWPAPPDDLRFGPDEVHVWYVDLESAGAADPDLPGLLSDDELSRAQRFVFDVHRRRFVTARGALRRVLSRYLGTRPEAIAFHYGAQGKPFISDGHSTHRLRFSVSHSRDRALFAMALGREVGVDLESIGQTILELDLAQRFFAPEEVLFLRDAPAEARRTAFYRLWTLKEAYLKARGLGLYAPLDSVVLRLDPGEQRPLVVESASGRWSLVELELGPDYAAAIAAEGEEWRVHCWAWASP